MEFGPGGEDQGVGKSVQKEGNVCVFKKKPRGRKRKNGNTRKKKKKKRRKTIMNLHDKRDSRKGLIALNKKGGSYPLSIKRKERCTEGKPHPFFMCWVKIGRVLRGGTDVKRKAAILFGKKRRDIGKKGVPRD